MKKKGRQSEIEKCGVQGYVPLCPAGDYRWHSELNQNCADCQGMGSATHWVPQERGVRLAPREQAEGEGCSHRVKIAFKWVFEISKNKLPLKSSTDSWYAGWMGAKWKVTLSLHLSSFEPLLHLGIIHFLTYSIARSDNGMHVDTVLTQGLYKGQVSHLAPN